MQITGMLLGAKLLKFVGSSGSEVLGPDEPALNILGGEPTALLFKMFWRL